MTDTLKRAASSLGISVSPDLAPGQARSDHAAERPLWYRDDYFGAHFAPDAPKKTR